MAHKLLNYWLKNTVFVFLLMSVFTLSAQSSTDIDNLYQGNDQKYYDKQTGKLYSGVAYNKYDNGQIGMKGNIKLGVFDGLWTWWYEDGAKKRETTYKDGLKEGYSYWWHKNGIKKAEIRFNGDKNIEQKRWDEKGNRLPNPKLGRG